MLRSKCLQFFVVWLEFDLLGLVRGLVNFFFFLYFVIDSTLARGQMEENWPEAFFMIRRVRIEQEMLISQHKCG